MSRHRHDSERVYHDQVATAGRGPSSAFYEVGALEKADAFFWERLYLARSSSVVELGCGPGNSIEALSQMRGSKAILVDVSLGMCKQARRRAAELDLHNRVVVIQAAAEALPLADRSVDLLIGHGVLHHLDLHAAERDPAGSGP